MRFTPAKTGRVRKRRQRVGESWLDKAPTERHVAMTWMRTKECSPGVGALGDIDIETCERCARQVKIIVEASNRCIEERVSHQRSVAPAKRRTGGRIERSLVHLNGKAHSTDRVILAEARTPPQARPGTPG